MRTKGITRWLRAFLVCWACCILVAGFAQGDSLAAAYGNTITADELMGSLRVLASDSMEGRDTGKPGQKMAAAYLRATFESMGIPPVPEPYGARVKEGYFQEFDLIETRSGGISLERGRSKLGLGDGLVYFNELLGPGRSRVGPVHYAGHCRDAAAESDKKAKSVLVDGSAIEPREIRACLEQLRGLSPELLFVYVGNLDPWLGFIHAEDTRMRLANDDLRQRERSGAQVILLDERGLTMLLGRRRAKSFRNAAAGAIWDSRAFLVVRPNEQRIVSENVLAFIEGTDLKDELVVLTAHYDHVGMVDGVVYNGADDDGSGTVALIEIAEAFALARSAGHGPRRSVLIMPVSGEEKGLLGSRYYSDNPVWPLDRTVANLNIDMIGRRDSAHATADPYVYIIGSDRLSKELHQLNESVNERFVGLRLDYAFNGEDDPNRFYYRSDHYNFARKGIPCIFYFSGVHEDYHQPGDDVERIEPGLLEQRARLVFHTAWELANRPDRVALDE